MLKREEFEATETFAYHAERIWKNPLLILFLIKV